MRSTDPHPKRVAVIGAGLAGLAAADRLAREGHEVQVFETQSRVGGRALTVTTALEGGLFAEAGPARFPPEFTRIFELARRLGLGVEPFYPETGTVVGYFGGNRIARYEPRPEEFWGYTSLRNAYPGFLERSAMRLALRVRALLRRGLGKPPWRTYRIRGGTELLAQSLASTLSVDFHLGSTVEEVSQTPDSVIIGTCQGGQKETTNFDYAVCAIPLSRVNALRFTPPLSEAKKDLASKIPFSNAIRLFLQMRRPYWRDEGQNGFAVTDTLGEIWDPNFFSPKTPALLVCYAKGDLARDLGGMAEAERLRHAVAELENIFPGSTDNFQTGSSFYWNDEPWIAGGWPLVREGFQNKVSVFRKPEGRVLFAGDFAADPRWLNMAEGAVESGYFAAGLIIRDGSGKGKENEGPWDTPP